MSDEPNRITIIKKINLACGLKLSGGEYDNPAAPYALWHARTQFLLDIDSRVPEVAEDLRKTPLTLYRKAGSPLVKLLRNGVPCENMNGVTIDDIIASEDYRLMEVGESLLEWQRRWNLIEAEEGPKWLLTSALSTLETWSRFLKSGSEFRYCLYMYTDAAPYGFDLDPPEDATCWAPEIETRLEYLERLKNVWRAHVKNEPFWSKLEPSSVHAAIETLGLNKEINRYCNELEKKCEARGWKKVDRNKDRLLPQFFEHLAWSVKFQVQEQSYVIAI